MCGSTAGEHQVLGQRLNRSQGFRPRGVNGISVSVMRCKACGLVFASPLPIPADLQDHYGRPPEEYFFTTAEAWTPKYFQRPTATAARLLPTNRRRALDCGAGLGMGMRSLKLAGFDTWGFEPSEPFHEAALRHGGIDETRLKLGAVEGVEYPTGSFDFVTFGAVFEHLYHPVSALKRALEWVAPGGLVHLEVPNTRYMVAKLLNAWFRIAGTNYVSHLSPMHPPYHLYEFSLESFEALAQREHLEIAEHWYDPGFVPGLPPLVNRALRAVMRDGQTGLQLTVFFRKPG